MNDTLKILESRRSCRNFDSDRMVSEEDIQAIIEAGTYAPSGMGRQSSIIIAVTNKELRDQLSAENAKIMGKDTDPFYGAPVILIVLADKDIPTYKYDGSLVMGNLLNAATSLFGFTERRKSLSQNLVRRFLLILALKAIMKASDIVLLDTQLHQPMRLRQEKIITFIM